VIGLDTNILVRYLAQDDPDQSQQAIELIERRLNEAEPGFISVVVLVETVWVLHRAYGLTDQQMAAVVEGLLAANALVLQYEQEVFAAMIALREGLGSFPDALIGELAASAGCSHILTFDRRALRLPVFEHV